MILREIEKYVIKAVPTGKFLNKFDPIWRDICKDAIENIGLYNKVIMLECEVSNYRTLTKKELICGLNSGIIYTLTLLRDPIKYEDEFEYLECVNKIFEYLEEKLRDYTRYIDITKSKEWYHRTDCLLLRQNEQLKSIKDN